MKKYIFLAVIFFSNLTQNSFGDIGPGFDVQNLYMDVPIICKATVQEVKPSLTPVIYEKRLFQASVASLKIDRCYKGSGSDVIKVKYPSGKGLFLNSYVYGWGWRKVEQGQTLLVFLKKEGAGYRFWHDVYDTFMPIAPATASKAEGFQAIREDIVNSLDKDLTISGAAMEQIKIHGWIEALPQLKSITLDDNYSKYVRAVVIRLYLGDRSAIDESLKFFDKSKQCEQSGFYNLPKEKQDQCNTLQYAQDASVWAYAELGTKKGQALMKSIVNGELPWLHSDVINSTKSQFQHIVTPQEIIEAGDKISSITLDDCTPLCFNWKEPGYKLLKAAGREDWYYSVRFDFENRKKIYSDMRNWWQNEGRKIFLEEIKN